MNNLFDKIISLKNFVILSLFVLILRFVNYLAPLAVLKYTSDVKIYGSFEYSFNLGQLYSSIAGFGLLGAFGYFVVRNKYLNYIPYFHLHYSVLILVQIVVILTDLNLLNSSCLNSVLVGILIADQFFLSALSKFRDKNLIAVIFDSSIYIILILLISILYLFHLNFSLYYWNLFLLILLVFNLIFIHIRQIFKLDKIEFDIVIEIYKFSTLIFISSPLILLLTSSTRLYIEKFISIEEVGYFSIYFRVASILLIAYRVVSIVMFKEFYENTHDKLDIKFSYIIKALIFVAIIIIANLSILKAYFPHISLTLNIDNIKLFIYCFFYIIAWIFSSFFEALFSRENIQIKFIYLISIVLIFLILTLFILSKIVHLNLYNIMILNTLSLMVFLYGQLYLLKKAKYLYISSLKMLNYISVFYILFIIFEK